MGFAPADCQRAGTVQRMPPAAPSIAAQRAAAKRTAAEAARIVRVCLMHRGYRELCGRIRGPGRQTVRSTNAMKIRPLLLNPRRFLAAGLAAAVLAASIASAQDKKPAAPTPAVPQGPKP